MRFLPLATAFTLVLGALALHREAAADLGWTEQQYADAYGQAQRSWAKANERSYRLGDSYLVVEFTPDNSASVGELWVLGTARDAVPPKVLEAGKKAEAGKTVAAVMFKSKSALPAEIREAEIDDVVVRVDVRNQLTSRIALCGRKPSCGLWRRIFGPACETSTSCPVLDRALQTDKTMDELHERMERAAEQGAPH